MGLVLPNNKNHQNVAELQRKKRCYYIVIFHQNRLSFVGCIPYLRMYTASYVITDATIDKRMFNFE